MTRHPLSARLRAAHPAARKNGPSRSVYSDPRFALTSAIVRRLAIVGPEASHRPSVVRRIQELHALGGLWDKIRSVEATVPAQQAADFEGILQGCAALPVLGMEPVAVLEFPEDAAEYLRGRRKQALRTNLRRATAGGSHVLRVPAGVERADWNRRARRYLAPGPPSEEGSWPIGETSDHFAVLALDAADDLLGIAVARRFGQWAILEMMFRFAKTDEASLARFLLHTALVDQLRAEGVRHLIAGGAFRLAPGLQYFQHLLGYEPMHVRIGSRVESGKISWKAGLKVWPRTR